MSKSMSRRLAAQGASPTPAEYNAACWEIGLRPEWEFDDHFRRRLWLAESARFVFERHVPGRFNMEWIVHCMVSSHEAACIFDHEAERVLEDRFIVPNHRVDEDRMIVQYRYESLGEANPSTDWHDSKRTAMLAAIRAIEKEKV